MNYLINADILLEEGRYSILVSVGTITFDTIYLAMF